MHLERNPTGMLSHDFNVPLFLFKLDQPYFDLLIKMVMSRNWGEGRIQFPELPVIVPPATFQPIPVASRHIARAHLRNTAYQYFRPCNNPNFELQGPHLDETLSPRMQLNKVYPSGIRESMEESVALMARNMLKDFQNFIGRHFSIYTKRAAAQIISQLTGLPKDNALVLGDVLGPQFPSKG
jgi:hypothetical protein